MYICKIYFTFLQMMEKFEDSLAATEGNMAQRLSKIEKRLESLETVVSALCLYYARLFIALYFLLFERADIIARELDASAKTTFTALYFLIF